LGETGSLVHDCDKRFGSILPVSQKQRETREDFRTGAPFEMSKEIVMAKTSTKRKTTITGKPENLSQK
jgi:hypothetical protein